jgi:hypothetical protein
MIRATILLSLGASWLALSMFGCWWGEDGASIDPPHEARTVPITQISVPPTAKVGVPFEVKLTYLGAECGLPTVRGDYGYRDLQPGCQKLQRYDSPGYTLGYIYGIGFSVVVPGSIPPSPDPCQKQAGVATACIEPEATGILTVYSGKDFTGYHAIATVNVQP